MSTQPVKSAAEPQAPRGESRLVTFEMVHDHPRVRNYIRMADAALEQIGYTEHGERHVGLVSRIAFNVLKRMGHPERECELAAIAGWMHDIGNAVNRDHHAQTGAVMAMQMLNDFGMEDREVLTVIAAIGNHHENDGDPVNPVAAAVILADKSDVHRTRVRNPDMIRFDIHDRVNYAVEKSFLNVDEDRKHITLELTIDPNISHVMEYFEIFMTRMLASRKAAKFLGATFGLEANGNRLV
ncbi:MAG TPA: HD domain-containing protein [Candidatus Acidoferrales bacterium]|nr:HD domain-containing protein [Candidatus Acidoferrales bacterium]